MTRCTPRDRAFSEFLGNHVVPHLPNVALVDGTLGAPSVPGHSLVRVPVAWIMARATASLSPSGSIVTSFLFEPVFIPTETGIAESGPVAKYPSRLGDEVLGVRLAAALSRRWERPTARYGSVASFLTHAVLSIDDSERLEHRRLVLAGAGCRVLLGDPSAAITDLTLLRDLPDSGDGGDEAVRFFAARLLGAVKVGIHRARDKLHEWRAERLAKALPDATWWSSS